MPSVSEAQQRLMRAAANNPGFARKVGISQVVAREYVTADQARGTASLPVRKPALVKR